MVKRIGNLWEKVVSMDNIKKAYANAHRGKTYRKEVWEIDANPEPYLSEVQNLLVNKTFRSSRYRMFKIHEYNKEREVADVPFFPDRIVHWALMQVIEPIIMNNLIIQTYAALPKRGSHQALHKLKEYLRNKDTIYCLKMDVRKFFPSVDKDILMDKLSRRIKDKSVLWLLRKIIYEFPHSGLPIGNYTSQYLANFYLSDLDHYLKEQQHCHYYLRYMDDMIIIGWSKVWLHAMKKKIDRFVGNDKLVIKGNWQVFPIDDRGVDFVGYRTFHGYCLLRTRIKRRLKKASCRLLDKLNSGESLNRRDVGCLSSYRGIIMHCNGYRLGCRTIYEVDRAIGRNALLV